MSFASITSIWEGALQWVPKGRVIWSDRCDAALREAMSPEHPLVVAARNSNGGGRQGAYAAADDLHLAVEKLFEEHGLDARSLLPSRDELADALMASSLTVHSIDPDGRPFFNRFLLIDLRQFGLVFSLSAGSAKKLTDDFEQPHVQWLARLAKDADLALGGFFFKRADRAWREHWAQGKLLNMLRHLETKRPIWVGDGEEGRWNLDVSQDVIRFFKGTASSSETDSFRGKRLASQRALTGPSLVDTKAPYAVSTPVPPGTYRCKDPRTGRWSLAIDTPSLYPVDDPIAGRPLGVPQVVDELGILVDQAQTIQWLLSEWGRNGQSLRELWPGLLARRYSTEALRRKHGPGAYYGGPTTPAVGHSWDEVSSWSRSIRANLDFYESGRLVRSLGPGEPPVEIEGCFPPSGTWAEPEDFQRIRRFLRARKSASRTSWSWSGMEITVNGISGRMVAPRDHKDGGAVRWSIELDAPLPEGDPARRGEGGFAPPVPDEALTTGIVQSLLSLNGRPLLIAIDRQQDLQGPQLDLAREVDTISADLARLERLVQTQSADLYAEDPETHEPLFPQHMRVEISRSLEATRGEMLELTHKRESATAQLEALREATPGVPIADLQAVLDGIHEPRTNVYRERLRRAVRRLDFTIDLLQRDRLKGRVVTFSGEFVLETSSGPHVVPFGGKYELGAAATAADTTKMVVAAMRAGALPVEYKRGSPHQVGVKLAFEALGVDPGRFGFRSCEDSRLFEVGMAALFPNPALGEDPTNVRTLAQLARDERLVEDFGDVERLAHRIRHVYETRRHPRWLEADHAAVEVDLMINSILAARGSVDPSRPTYEPTQVDVIRRRMLKDDFKKNAWTWSISAPPQLARCRHCSSQWLVPLRIHEVAGYLCLDCRFDGGGIRWPARFDRFVLGLEAWKAVAAPLLLPAAEVPAQRHQRRRLRQLTELSDTERADLIAAYVDGETKVKDLAQAFEVSNATLLRLVREAGVPTRYSATSSRWRAAEAVE